MTKVAIKNESITSFGRINHIMDVFSNLAFEKLTESVLADADAAVRHSAMEASWALSSSVTFVWKLSRRYQCSYKTVQSESWHTVTLCWPYQYWTSTKIYNDHKTSEKNIDIQNIDLVNSHLPLFFYDWKYSFYDEYCWIQTK